MSHCEIRSSERFTDRRRYWADGDAADILTYRRDGEWQRPCCGGAERSVYVVSSYIWARETCDGVYQERNRFGTARRTPPETDEIECPRAIIESQGFIGERKYGVEVVLTGSDKTITSDKVIITEKATE